MHESGYDFGAFIHTLCGTLRFVAQRWDRLTMQSTLGMIVHELDTDFWCNGTHTMCVACILDKGWNALGLAGSNIIKSMPFLLTRFI